MKPASIWDWLGPLALVTIFICYLFLSKSSEISLCEGANCFREWVAALSGWAALGAAIVTLSIMREQVEDQRRQTDYIVGNMPPELTAEPRSREDEQQFFQTIQITIINRNRRSVRIGKIAFLGDERIKLGVYRSAIGDDVEEKFFATVFPSTHVHRVIPGKEDGAAAPRCVIDCHVFWEGKISALENDPDGWVEFSGKITAAAYVKEESERLVMLEQHIVFDL